MSLALAATGLLAQRPALAQIVPADRATTWNPGIPGGIRAHHGVRHRGRGREHPGRDQRLPGGSGGAARGGDVEPRERPLRSRTPSPSAVRVPGSQSSRARAGSNVITIGTKWYPKFTQTTNLAANAAKGGKTVALAAALGLSVGEIVVIDQLTDPNLTKWGYTNCQTSATRAAGGSPAPTGPLARSSRWPR